MTEPGWIGKVLGGRYRLDSLLGQGGMSSVYKATDPNLRRTVAVKLIHSHLTGDPEFVRRFETEASAVAQLHHPNIIQVYDFNRDNETYYMVLEFVPGESLDRRLRRLAGEGRHLAARTAAEITAEIADAMDYAHGQGLIHRDIKPANIMLTERGHAVLMDFGVAKIVGATQNTASGAVVGTASYISPEQVRGEPPSGASDQYALGASLFEMLAGRPPFQGDSVMSVMLKHLNEPLPDLRHIAPETPAALVRVAETALAKEPRQRFASAHEMAAALQRIVAELAAERTGSQEAAPAHPGPIAATVVDDEPQRGPTTGPAAPGWSPPPAPAQSPVAAASGSARVAAGDPSTVKSSAGLPAAAAAVQSAPAPGTSHVSALSAQVLAVPKPVHRGGRSIWLAGGAVAVLLCLGLGVTAAVAGLAAVPFMFAAPTPPPTTAPGAVLFQDDFSTPAGKWTTEATARGSAQYGQGEYVMQLTNANDIQWSTAATGQLADIHTEVTAANTGQAQDVAFGLVCDHSDNKNFYLLGFNSNGYYAIIKVVDGTATLLTDDRGQWVHSIWIAGGAPSYRVGADCRTDGTLTLYADGRQVATAKDTTFTSGTIGLFVRSFYQGPAEVRYRDVIVSALR